MQFDARGVQDAWPRQGPDGKAGVIHQAIGNEICPSIFSFRFVSFRFVSSRFLQNELKRTRRRDSDDDYSSAWTSIPIRIDKKTKPHNTFQTSLRKPKSTRTRHCSCLQSRVSPVSLT